MPFPAGLKSLELTGCAIRSHLVPKRVDNQLPVLRSSPGNDNDYGHLLNSICWTGAEVIIRCLWTVPPRIFGIMLHIIANITILDPV
jgi:hypothetical protein